MTLIPQLTIMVLMLFIPISTNTTLVQNSINVPNYI